MLPMIAAVGPRWGLLAEQAPLKTLRSRTARTAPTCAGPDLPWSTCRTARAARRS